MSHEEAKSPPKLPDLMSPTEAPLFDETAIDRLRAVAGSDDEGFIAEMAQLFMEETTRSLDELGTAAGEGDWKGVNRLSHSLKSAAATFGLVRLRDACLALEINTKGYGDDTETKSMVAQVFHEFEQARGVMSELA